MNVLDSHINKENRTIAQLNQPISETWNLSKKPQPNRINRIWSIGGRTGTPIDLSMHRFPNFLLLLKTNIYNSYHDRSKKVSEGSINKIQDDFLGTSYPIKYWPEMVLRMKAEVASDWVMMLDFGFFLENLEKLQK